VERGEVGRNLQGVRLHLRKPGGSKERRQRRCPTEGKAPAFIQGSGARVRDDGFFPEVPQKFHAVRVIPDVGSGGASSTKALADGRNGLSSVRQEVQNEP